MNSAPKKKAVLFIDVLGFASLVNTYPLDVSDLVGQDRLDHRFARIFDEGENRLTSVFWGFHNSLKWALEIARLSHPVTAISFSDSAFIATDHVKESVGVSIRLMQSLLSGGIPARAGIAYGTFAAVRFKSDIGLDSGEHAAHFLGTGVVGAHDAEGCGPKGVRILLHPSVSPLLDETAPLLELPERERRNDIGVRHEIDYWSFNVTNGREAWHRIQDLWTAAPSSAQPHYEASAEAIHRMRVRQGYEPMNNLRRRTLTKRRAASASQVGPTLNQF
jgi:hypothetical protein